MPDDEKKTHWALDLPGCGAMGTPFHDMAPEHRKTRNWSTSAPAWRQAVAGVNLEGMLCVERRLGVT